MVFYRERPLPTLNTAPFTVNAIGAEEVEAVDLTLIINEPVQIYLCSSHVQQMFTS